jgi:hypothetical protein
LSIFGKIFLTIREDEQFHKNISDFFNLCENGKQFRENISDFLNLCENGKKHLV